MTAEHWLHHGCNASLAEISTCFHFVAISWPPCPHLGHQQPGQCLQQRAAERQNIVSLSIALVLYYLDNMCSMLLCSPKTSKPELRDVCVVGGCYKGGLWPEWMASPTLSGQPQVARGFKNMSLATHEDSWSWANFETGCQKRDMQNMQLFWKLCALQRFVLSRPSSHAWLKNTASIIAVSLVWLARLYVRSYFLILANLPCSLAA